MKTAQSVDAVLLGAVGGPKWDNLDFSLKPEQGLLRIRKELDKNNFKNVQILSYAVKYASNFYGPFRDAVGSKKILSGDKKTYQMDFNNSLEAIRETALDIKEGADMVMVKPGMPYLDIISMVKQSFKIPVLAYQVSGEYSLICHGIKKGMVDKNTIIEVLTGFKRAGANAVVTKDVPDYAIVVGNPATIIRYIK